MLLAIDIGNTNITFGIFQENNLIKRFDIPTKTVIHSRRGRLNVPYNAIFRKNNIDDVIICSVAPAVTNILGEDLKKIVGRKPYYIGKDIIVPMRNLYRKPQQVGQDRLANAYAGVMLYSPPLIIVDFGTAITFDIISGNREYLGGMILPGLEISLDVLAERAALLPKIRLEKPKEFIGKDTKNSILSGIVYGFAALTDDLVARIRDKIGKGAKVIGTGGNISLISKYSRRIDKIDKDLTLKGLNLLYNKALKNYP